MDNKILNSQQNQRNKKIYAASPLKSLKNSGEVKNKLKSVIGLLILI